MPDGEAETPTPADAEPGRSPDDADPTQGAIPAPAPPEPVSFNLTATNGGFTLTPSQSAFPPINFNVYTAGQAEGEGPGMSDGSDGSEGVANTDDGLEQEDQPVSAGNGTPAANILEGEETKMSESISAPEAPEKTAPEAPEAPEAQETSETPETPETPMLDLGDLSKLADGPGKRPDKEVRMPQSRMNEIVKREREDEAAKIRAEYEAKQADAQAELERQAAVEKEEWRTLWQTEQEKTRTQSAEIEALKASVAERELAEAAKASEVNSYRALINGSVDAKVAEWPEEIKALDPKETNPEGYTLQQRLQWVSRAEVVVKKMQATPPAQGNTPLPEPAGQAGEATTQEQLNMAEAEFRRVHPFVI